MSTWETLTNQERFDVLKKMNDYGGGFAQKLVAAWMVADSGNSIRLGIAFDHLVKKYATHF